MPKCSNLMLTDTIMLCPPVSIVSIPIQFCRFVKISQSLAGFVLSDLVPIRIHLFASDAKWSIKIRTSFSQLQQHILHKNCSVGVCIGLFQHAGATPSPQLTIVETERMWSERNDWAMPAKIVQHWIIKSCCAGPRQSPCPSINRLWWCSKRDPGSLSVSVNIQNIN